MKKLTPLSIQKIGVFLLERYRQIKISQLKDFFKDCADKLIRELLRKKEIDGISDLAGNISN